MASHYQLYFAGLTDTGQARKHNEDAISWDFNRGFALLADGMGGHNAGDVASRMCIDKLNSLLASSLDKSIDNLRPNKGVSKHATLLRRLISKANTTVYENSLDNKEREGMGATLASILFYDDRVVIAHLGDSRVYRLRKKELEQLTIDHSLVQELLDKGVISDEEVVDNPYSHVITQAVGIRPKVVAEINEYEVMPGDVFLLCSDGLTDMVNDEEIKDSLLVADGHWDQASQHLVDLANQHGGHDNISVILASVGARR
jgi:serine/threonine protein phosphatase PrpC